METSRFIDRVWKFEIVFPFDGWLQTFAFFLNFQMNEE